jgi:fatty-acyl-CoA synthase
MRGLMMERPLLISGLLEHAAAVHGDREIVSYAPEEPVYRGCYRALAERVRQLAGVSHTVNPRLHPDQVAWILNHAADALMFVDLAFLPQAERAAKKTSRCRWVLQASVATRSAPLHTLGVGPGAPRV